MKKGVHGEHGFPRAEPGGRARHVEGPNRPHGGDGGGFELILAIETSCDETAAAVVTNEGRVLSNVVASQAELHDRYGGVVPEIASRRHLELLMPVVNEALERADGVGLDDVDSVAVTRGPGLVGALLIGLSAAKALAWSRRLPLVPVDHLHGHVAALYLEPTGDRDGRGAREELPLDPPFLCLLASGGHTLLLDVHDRSGFTAIGTTLDDAAGEAFDKVARFLGLDYPGGPEIDRLSLLGDPEAIAFPRAMMNEPGFDVSYSGLKTAVINYVRKAEARGEDVKIEDVAASFQQAVVDLQVAKTMAAVEHVEAERLFLCGGVAANSGLRRGLSDACAARGVRLFVPPLELCTDNAAMVAACGTAMLRRGLYTDLEAAPDPNLPLT